MLRAHETRCSYGRTALPDSKPAPLTTTGSPAQPALEPAEQLARLWEQGGRIDLDSFLQTAGPLSAAELSAVLYVDQHQRWQMGERTGVESYLRRYSEICSDVDAVVDVIFHEYLLREQLGEHPSSQEFTARFPQYAGALASQIAFHLLLTSHARSVSQPRADTSNVSMPARDESLLDLAAQERIGRDARGGLSSNRDVQTLLRHRLRIFAVISGMMFLLNIAVAGRVFGGYSGVALYGVIVAETSLIAALLWSHRALSMRALRWIEFVLVGSVLCCFAWEQAQLFESGNLISRAGHGWIGPIVAARSLNWSWALLIIIYGIWIPNTARRSTLAVAAIFIATMAITCGLALTAESAPASAIAAFVLYSTTHTAAAAAIAIFGAYRIQTLQRAVVEARRLGPYRLLKRLGAGGMGEVYLAEHALLRRPCALKLIRPDQDGDARLLSRFEREVQIMATLTHPNTVRVYDYGLATDGTFYYAMEYLPGLSLQELVTQYGPVPPGRAVHFLRQVCDALREAHAIGLIHRDIKPANILASQIGGSYDVAKLLDFGLVRSQSLSNDGPSLTMHGAIAGTPAFMSPEQAATASDVDQRSDIYSLGAVVYFLMTGRPPFVHSTSVQTMAAHISEPVVPPGSRVAGIPADLEEVILCCLQKEPAQRYQDILAVDQALAKCACSGA